MLSWVLLQGSIHYVLVLPGDSRFEHGVFQDRTITRQMVWGLMDGFCGPSTLRAFLNEEFAMDVFRMNDHQVIDALTELLVSGACQILAVETEVPTLAGGYEPEPEPEKEPRPAPVKQTTWIAVQLLDEADSPVPGVRYEIARPNGALLCTGTLDGEGSVHVTDIPAGEYEVGFPELDRNVWSSPVPPEARRVTSQHVVRQGECIESIAHDHGLFWPTVWNHPKNRELRQRCAAPNVLAPGDTVAVPEKLLTWDSVRTGRTHQFRVRGVPFKLQLRLLDETGRPRTGVSYALNLPDGATLRGTASSDGWIKQHVPARATTARLDVLTEEGGVEQYELMLGGLDPIYELTGIQQRLRNLGHVEVDTTGELDPATEAALREFQIAHGVALSGEPDEQTLDRLLDVHGC